MTAVIEPAFVDDLHAPGYILADTRSLVQRKDTQFPDNHVSTLQTEARDEPIPISLALSADNLWEQHELPSTTPLHPDGGYLKAISGRNSRFFVQTRQMARTA